MRGTVYVVDDDSAVLESLEALLRTSGFEPRVFDNADSFLAAFDAGAADCVLLDVRMPGTDGLTLLERLGPVRRSVPVVMMTAHGDVPMAARAMRAGASDLVEKPFQPMALVERVAAAIARADNGVVPDPVLAERFSRLTPRESEVMRLMVEGLPNKLIAHELGLSPRTVEVHRGRVMHKTGAASLAQLVRMAIGAALLPDAEAGR